MEHYSFATVTGSLKHSQIEWPFSPPAAGEHRYDLNTSFLAGGGGVFLCLSHFTGVFLRRRPVLAQRQEAAPIISTRFRRGQEQGGLVSREGCFVVQEKGRM